MHQGLAMSAPRGTTVLVGLPPAVESLTISPFDFIRPERVLTGSFMGTVNTSVDIPRLVELYQVGRLKLDELITGRYPLEQINEAIESVERGEALRNVIVF
jgi:S-(hydroxymethyl)glutathione dehydrogenase/alcohol dehydrogenase